VADGTAETTAEVATSAEAGAEAGRLAGDSGRSGAECRRFPLQPVLAPVTMGGANWPGRPPIAGLVGGTDPGVIRAHAWAAACSAAALTAAGGTRLAAISRWVVAPAAFQAYASITPTATGAIAETSPAPLLRLIRQRSLIPGRTALPLCTKWHSTSPPMPHECGSR
jgi:hypothetical protein